MNAAPKRRRRFRGSAIGRGLALRLLSLERGYLARQKKWPWLRRFGHAELFSFRPVPLARGMAIGMFWACMPMPFQMFPATLFCWMLYGNLPVAFLCVWLSNPLTYLPVFYVEYVLGLWLIHGGDAGGFMSLTEFSRQYGSVAELAGAVYFVVLEGALALGVLLGLAGYFAGGRMGKYLSEVSKTFARRVPSAERED